MGFLNIIFSITVSIFICIGYGSCLLYFLKIKDYKNKELISEYIIIGVLFIGVIALLLNFITSINLTISNTISIIGILLFLFFFKKINKNTFLNIIYIQSITLILLIFSKHQEDFPWYSLPFISILNEEKIIFGLANVQFRFGHISLLQYSSSIFNNFLSINNILTPYALIVSSFIIFCTKIFIKNLNNSKNKISFLYIALVLIFCLLKFTRYNEFGNDIPAHIIVFYSIYKSIFIVENLFRKAIIFDDVKKLLIFSSFALMQKIQTGFIVLLPICIIYLLSKEKLQINKIYKTIIVCVIFLSLWSFKTFVNTGCFIYPAQFTCINNISWVSKNFTQHSYAKKVKIESESWSKGWVDQNKLAYEEYSQNFNWLKTWLGKHFIVIIKSISPFIILILLPIIYLNIIKKNKYNFKKSYIKIFSKQKIIIYIILINIIIWFLSFPIYRYGLAFIISGAIFCVIPLYFLINYAVINKIIKKIIIFLFIFFISKNIIRIINYSEIYDNYPWPKIFSEKNNQFKNYKKVYKDNKQYILYPADERACYYSYYTCSHHGHIFDNELVIKLKKYNYKTFEYK
jgi:hypothetical protein